MKYNSSIDSLTIKSSKENYIKKIKEDFDILKKIKISSQHPQFKGQRYYKIIFDTLKELSMSNSNCKGTQYACVYPDRPHQVFISHRLFSLSHELRMAVIIHEIYHLVYNDLHVSCKSKKILNYSCSNDINSSFGLEYYFLEDLKNMDEYSNRQDIQDYQRGIKHRINSFW